MSQPPSHLSQTRPSFPADYPAEYLSSGVVTFVVTQDGLVYEKDLGPSTTTVAPQNKGPHRFELATGGVKVNYTIPAPAAITVVA